MRAATSVSATTARTAACTAAAEMASVPGRGAAGAGAAAPAGPAAALPLPLPLRRRPNLEAGAPPLAAGGEADGGAALPGVE